MIFRKCIPPILAACLAAAPVICSAQSRHLIDVWTPYDGLPQSRVLGITQTPDGYLWVSTQLGWFARFDGIRFTHYHPHNTPALVSPEIQKLFVTETGDLWVADVDGRLILRKDDKFENLAGEKPGYRKRVVEYLGTSNGERRFVTAASILIRLGRNIAYENEDNPLPHLPANIRQFCQDGSGEIWCRTTDGTLGRWRNEAFEAIPQDQLPAPSHVNHLLPSHDGGIWIATAAGLWKLEGDSITDHLPDLSTTGILQLAESTNHHLWLRDADGVTLIRDGEMIHRTILTGIPPAGHPRQVEMHADSSIREVSCERGFS
jgi:ligand-binding sensor domain-containing protein